EQLHSLLKTYNSYYSDQENLQLSYDQREGSKPFIEGVLSIFWGVRHPIRLKIQDEKQIPSFVTLKSTENVGLFPSKRGMTRWGEFDDLHHISGETLKSTEEKLNSEKSYSYYESSTLKSKSEQEHDCATLPRAVSSTAAVRKRTKFPMIARTEVETHRFSINGHFYNYETSIFTPASGSETKIRINSHMRTREVIEQLLRKFKVSELEEITGCCLNDNILGKFDYHLRRKLYVVVMDTERRLWKDLPLSKMVCVAPLGNMIALTMIENHPCEFALYIIHVSGEKKQLRSGDIPLLHRLLQGPSEKAAKFFLMDRDVEEVSSDVAQYIQFHLPFLESILQRINKEEEQEIQQTRAKCLTHITFELKFEKYKLKSTIFMATQLLNVLAEILSATETPDLFRKSSKVLIKALFPHGGKSHGDGGQLILCDLGLVFDEVDEHSAREAKSCEAGRCVSGSTSSGQLNSSVNILLIFWYTKFLDFACSRNGHRASEGN
ncbi:hypothetical protein CIB84_002425, partial [Bambusicola thoracicus]